MITQLSQLPMDRDTISWALHTEVGWGLWLFLICFLENHLLQFLIFICTLESLSSGSCCLSCSSSQPFYTSKLSQSNCFSGDQAGLLLSPKIHLLTQQVCPFQTSSEGILMWWEYSTNVQTFWKDWCLPLKSLVADTPTLLSGAALYAVLFSGVAQQWYFRFWDCNTYFCHFKTFLLLSFVVITLLYNSELSLLIHSSEITPYLSCGKLSFNSEMILVWFGRVPGYELIDFVMLKFTFALETKLTRCLWRNLNSLKRILFSPVLSQSAGTLACYIQETEKFLVFVYKDGNGNVAFHHF